MIYIFSLLLIHLIICHTAFAQYDELHEVYMCQNTNGITEILKVGESKVYYSSSKNSKELLLKVISKDGLLWQVQFPNDAKVYHLQLPDLFEENMICTNPDKSQQVFYHQAETDWNLGEYKCVNTDGTTEYLFFKRVVVSGSAQLQAVYYSDKKTTPIKLIVANVKEEAICKNPYSYCEVQFPEDKRIYQIHFSKENMPKLKSVSSDGSVRHFIWTKKYPLK